MNVADDPHGAYWLVLAEFERAIGLPAGILNPDFTDDMTAWQRAAVWDNLATTHPLCARLCQELKVLDQIRRSRIATKGVLLQTPVGEVTAG